MKIFKEFVFSCLVATGIYSFGNKALNNRGKNCNNKGKINYKEDRYDKKESLARISNVQGKVVQLKTYPLLLKAKQIAWLNNAKQNRVA
jgi:hypothetical protein